MDEQVAEMTNMQGRRTNGEHRNQLLHTDIVKAIKDGQLTIEDETMEFVKLVYDDQILMYIPTAFEMMTPELMDIKYPSSRRPEYIYTSESTSINVTMKMMEQELNRRN